MSYCSRLTHAVGGVALASVVWMLQPAPASAQNPDSHISGSTHAGSAAVDEGAKARAAQHFERAVALYRDGAFEGALVEFRRAYEAVPTPGLFFNMGQTAVRLNDYAQAKVLFERYLQSSADELSPERRQLVASELKQLGGRIGYAQISVSVNGAEVWVDQHSVGRTPLSAPLTLNVGRHHVEVRADGYQAAIQTVELAGGEERTVDFRLQPLLSAQRGSSPASPPATAARTAAAATGVGGRAWLRPARIASLSVLGVAAASAVATGVLASNAYQDLKAELASRPGDPGAIDAARQRARMYGMTSDASLGLAVVSAALSVTFLWMERTDRSALSVAVAPTGVAVKGAF